ncbi:MAG: hypothetical protein WCK81_10910 [Betaproteobacteria bacterium]
MAISSISAQNTYTNSLAKLQHSINNLVDALKAGDMTAAKAAYTAAGLPATAPGNSTALGRLYQAIQAKDVHAAQSAAAALNLKPSGTTSNVAKNTGGKSAPTAVTSDAQKAALALANARTAMDESSLFAYMDPSTNADSNMFSSISVGSKVDLSA